jgi:hypothetical protein
VTKKSSEVRHRALAWQRELATLSALFAHLLAGLWHILDVHELKRTQPVFIAACQDLTIKWAEVAAVMAAEYYAAMRSASGVAGTAPGLGAPSLPVLDQIAAEVKWATKDLWGATPELAAAKKLAEGALTRLAIDAPARQTVIDLVEQDHQALAWSRIAGDSHPCSFCAMLISRGPIFRSEAKADFRAHDNCKCLAVPVFSKSDAALLWSQELADAWARVTAGLHGKNAIKEWRRWYDHGGAAELAADIP